MPYKTKHPTGKCKNCDHPETVYNMIMECKVYKKEKKEMKAALQNIK